MSLQLGIRYDRNHDQALAASLPASPLFPNLLPAVSFGGVDPGIVFNDFSPRLGMTYDLTGDHKTIVKLNYARYYGQVGTGGISSQVNPLSSVTVRYPWTDLNGDKVFQTNEVFPKDGDFANFQSLSGNWDPANPASPTTSNLIDPNIKNDTTDEFIVGATRELGKSFAVDVSYIHRKYGNFQQTVRLHADGTQVSTADYVSTTYVPTCTVSGARCETVTTYYPTAQLRSQSILTMQPTFNRTYNGVEASATKRMANHWMLNTSFSYNSTIEHYGDGDFQNPNNIDKFNGAQYAPQTSGSGIGNVFLNAKWQYKLSGLYQFPYQINLSAFYNTRQGYPWQPAVQVLTSLPNGGGQPTMILDPIGEARLPNFQNLDLHVERPISFGNSHIVPSMDIFNVTNNNTIQALRGNQNANNANFIQAIVAPRVLRFGVRVNW
jgi:hypothetical protein